MKQQISKTAWFGILFYVFIACIALFGKTAVPAPFPKRLFEDLLKGKMPFKPVGHQFEIFKPLLPPHEKVSFIMDMPFSPYLTRIEQLYSAQAYLAPTILTYETASRVAIIYCSNIPLAQRRMEETGYRILLPLAEGKGIAVKK